ncbi:MAG TPA: DinB family protein [Verrucomicrobiae bacterium]|jgi:hypothetical protein|nr:DinB family protein [Verrucomicrobiae bacterium]
MKHLRVFCLLAVLTLAAGALAQGSGVPAKPAGAAPQAQTTPQPAPTISSIIDRQISTIEKQFVDAAEAMPEAKFNFTPESLNIQGSDYKGVRTFALEVKHVATANYFFWCSVTGDKLPEGIKGPNGPDELKTKAEIIQFLKDSFALGHKAAATLTGENATEMLPFRQNKAPRLNLAASPVAHAFDHYGQMVEYLRMNGIVPPASQTR